METLRKYLFVLLLALPAIVFADELVNINTANKETLMSIKGIGEARAEAIIKYREQNGPFRSVEQLREVEGIGNAVIEAGRSVLTVSENKR